MCLCVHVHTHTHENAQEPSERIHSSQLPALPAAGETLMSENGSLPSLISEVIDSGGTHIVCYENKIF